MKEPKSETVKQELFAIEKLNEDRDRIKTRRAQENKRKYEAINGFIGMRRCRSASW
jgi:hypothetical protein